MTSGPGHDRIPPRLIDAVDAGRCIAFVGAGFSAPRVPTWRSLLDALARRSLVDDPSALARVGHLIETGDSRDLEAAAQILRDRSDPSGLQEHLAEVIREHPVPDGESERMDRRVGMLGDIPFRAVLTTNFDDTLRGDVPDPSIYLEVLRGRSAWSERGAISSQSWRFHGEHPIVKLHGDLSTPGTVVLSTRDYRARLYRDPGYMTFLRSVMATSTVLYLGVSFTDAYVNQLRSEILEFIGFQPGDEPLGFAVIADVGAAESAYMIEHEGIVPLTYSTVEDPDHHGFDRWLTAIHRETNPVRLLGRVIGGRRILWSDPAPENNAREIETLRRAAGSSGREPRFTQVADLGSTMEELSTGEYDLVISNWGHAESGPTRAQALMSEMAESGTEVPVVVYGAPGPHAAENKRAALRSGAVAFEVSPEGLFDAIERVFAPPR